MAMTAAFATFYRREKGYLRMRIDKILQRLISFFLYHILIKFIVLSNLNDVYLCPEILFM